MRAILIDTPNREISEVTIKDGDRLQEYYRLLDCTNVDVAGVGLGDDIYVDGEGALGNGDELHVFMLPDLYPAPLCGKGLLVSCDREGNSVDAKSDIEVIRAQVMWGSRINGRMDEDLHKIMALSPS
jgi:hypothetical protein